MEKRSKTALSILFGLLIFTLTPGVLFAHCDGLDGPVVKAARKALESGDVNLVLPWVQKADEPEIRSAFEKTLSVRKGSKEAQELADNYFFETLVRVHRAGEGAPYTRLKPVGRDLGPAIPAADKALETKSADALLQFLTNELRSGLHARFRDAVQKGNYRKDDVEAGRAYMKAYVDYIHYVEQLHAAAKGPAAGHSHEAEASSSGEHDQE